jgi:glycosyltransferase involved in cell wall biosynthesis
MIPVALVIGRLNVGGAEAELVRLANGLDRSRFKPFVVTLQDRGPLAGRLGPDVELVELGRKRKWSWGAYAALGRVLRERAPRIVQSFLFTENVFCRRIGVGAVVSGLQGSLSDDAETGPSMKLSVERWTWPRARAVVSNSNFYRDRCRDLGMDASKIEVIPSAVEPREAAGRGVREAFGIRPDEVLVTCVARLVERKGHDDLLRAGAGLRLLFAGDGPYRRRLEGRGAVLAGRRDDVHEILAASDVVALPSRFGEGCPNALLEAMAAGKAVVAARSGGIPELVEDGVTGLLHRPGDVDGLRGALHRLAADPALRARLGAAGRERARERHGIGPFLKAYEALYFKLTETSAPV